MSTPARLLAVACLALAALVTGASLVTGDSGAAAELAALPRATPAAPAAPSTSYEFVEGGQYSGGDCVATLRVYVSAVPSTWPSWYAPSGSATEPIAGSGACSNTVRTVNRSANGGVVSVDYPFYILNQGRVAGRYKVVFLGFTAYFDIAPYVPPTPVPTPVYADAVTGRILDASGRALAGANVAASAMAWVKRSFGGMGDLADVDCPTATKCEAVGKAGILLGSLNGGASWQMQEWLTLEDLFDVSCPSATACFALGAAGTFLATTDGGADWSNKASAPDGLQSISCPTASVCFGAGSDTFARTTNGGTSWWSSSPFTLASDIDCPTALACFVIGAGNKVSATTNGGSTWQSQQTGAEVDLFSALSCPTATTCFAAGQTDAAVPVVAGTTDGGAHWSGGSLPASLADRIAGIDCPTAGACFLVGEHGATYATADGGAGWQVRSPFQVGSWSLKSLSCPTDTSCISVGEHGTVGTCGPVNRYEATTDAAGNYMLDHIAPDTYTLLATRGGYSFAPEVRIASVPPSVTGQDFAGDFTGSLRYLPLITRAP